MPPGSDESLNALHRGVCIEILEYVGARYSVTELEIFEGRIAEGLLSLIYVFKTLGDVCNVQIRGASY